MPSATRTLQRTSIHISLAFAAALVTGPDAKAQTFTWINPAGGNWTDPPNWDTPPTFNSTTTLNFPTITATAILPLSYTTNYGTTTVNQLLLNNFASPDLATAANAGLTIRGNGLNFSGVNPSILQNGTGAVVFTFFTTGNMITTNSGSNLTIGGSGTGNLNIGGQINGTGNVIYNQTGVGSLPSTGSFVIVGATSISNNYSGSTTINSGNIVIVNGNSFPTTSPIINNGGNIQATAVLPISNPITLNSALNLSGVGNGLIFTGAITGNGGILVKNFFGTPNHIFGNTISGTGAITIDSYAGGTPVMTLGVSPFSSATQGTALNASSYSITNGSLIADNANAARTRLNSAAPMTMNSGTFQLTGNTAATVSESLASLTLSGMNTYLNAPTSAQPISLTFGSLTRQNGATFQVTSQGAANNFGQTPGNGVGNLFVTTSLAGDNINGVLPYGSALINPTASQASTFVRYSAATGVTPLSLATDYDTRHPYLLGSSPTVNYRIASGGTFGNTIGGVSGTQSINSLLLETNGATAQTLAAGLYGNGTLQLTSGALMFSLVNGTNLPTQIPSVIQPNIALGGTTGYFHSQFSMAGISFVSTGYPSTLTATGSLGNVIAGNVTGTAGLVKTGAGNLQLAGDNSGLSGGLTVNGGNLIFDRDVNLGAPGEPLVLAGGVAASINGGLSFFPNPQFGSVASSSVSVNRNITLGPAGGSVGAVLPGTVLSLPGVISGGRLAVTGPGMTLVTNSNNSFTDAYVASGGYLAASSDAALGAGAGKIFLGAQSTFQPTTSFSTSRDIALVGGVSVINTGVNDFTLNGQILGVQPNNSSNSQCNLQKSGLGNLTLTNAALFNGTFMIGENIPTRLVGSQFAQPGGTITLSGPNGAMAEAVSYWVNPGAKIVLDNSGPASNLNSNRLSSSALTLYGGELKLIGNANASTTELVGRTKFAGGGLNLLLNNTITVAQPTSAGGQHTSLVFTSFGYNGLGTAFFRGDNLGGTSGDFTTVSFVTAPTLTNGLFPNGLYANSSTANPQDFATINGQNQVVAFSNYTALPTAGGATTTTHNLIGAQTQTGATSSNALKISNGQLDLAGNGLTFSGSGQILSTGALNQDSILSSTGPATITFGSTVLAQFSVNSSLDIGSADHPVNLTSNFGFAKLGTGELRLSGASGGWRIGEGSIKLLTPSSVGVSMAPGATLDLNNFGSVASPVHATLSDGFGNVKIGTGAFIHVASTSTTFGGSFEGTAASTFIKSGSFNLTLNGNSPNFAGAVVAGGDGALVIGANVVPSDPVNPGPLGRGTTPIQIGDTTGTGGTSIQLGQLVTRFERDINLVAGSTGTIFFNTLNGSNATSVNNGAVVSVTSNITMNSRTLQINVGTQNGTVPTFGATTFSGVISGTGANGGAGIALDIEGGNVNLWGNNTFTGIVNIFDYSRAVLGLGHDNAFGNSANPVQFQTAWISLRADNGTRNIANTMDFATSIGSTATTVPIVGVNDLNWNGNILAGNAARTFQTTSTGITTFAGTITGNGASASIVKTGGGVLVLSGDNTFAGGVNLSGGVLGLGRDSTGSPSVTSGPLGTGTLTINNGTTVRAVGGARTVNNAISLGGNFAIDGSNDLTLGGNIALGTATRTVVVSNTGTTTFAGNVTSSTSGVGLTKDGNGLLVLTGPVNSFIGFTTVNRGELRVNGTFDSSGNGVFVNSGATLSGNGTISQNVTVNSGAILKPGSSPGILNVGGTVTMSAGAIHSFQYAGPVTSQAYDSGLSATPGAGTGANNHLTITGNYTVDPNAIFKVNGNMADYALNQPYSFRVASVTGSINGGAGFNITNPAQFDFSNFTGFAGATNLQWHSVGNVAYFNFTPVPEPLHILLVAGAGAAGFRWVRRRRSPI